MTPLLEITYSEHSTVDREAGVIRGVKILGRQSRNGREYSEQALADAARLYEGIGVNLNHPEPRDAARHRPVEAGFGWLTAIAIRPEGVFGDLHYFKSHPQAAVIVEAAERNPRRFGLSHHAEGRVGRHQGKPIVESIEHVRSVDLVQNPATNAGLFESEELFMSETTSKTIRQILSEACSGGLAPLCADERLAEHAARTLEFPAAASADEQLAQAVRQLVEGLLPQGTGPQTPVTTDAPLAQLAERVARLETAALCRELLEAHRRTCDGTRLKALAALTTVDERVRLIESWPESASFPPLAGRSPRPAVSRPLVEAESLALPADARALAAALR
jgi:hypothetical protein